MVQRANSTMQIHVRSAVNLVQRTNGVHVQDSRTSVIMRVKKLSVDDHYMYMHILEHDR